MLNEFRLSRAFKLIQKKYYDGFKTFFLHFRMETKPDICNINQATGEFYDHFCILLHNDVQYQVGQGLLIYMEVYQTVNMFIRHVKVYCIL